MSATMVRLLAAVALAIVEHHLHCHPLVTQATFVYHMIGAPAAGQC